MTAVINASVLRFVLTTMSRAKTFYVLGAGASFGLVPLTPQIRSSIERWYDGIGIYPTLVAPRSPLFERVIGEVPIEGRGSRRLLLRNIAPGTLDILVQRGLWRPVDGVVPPQYAVFDAVGRPSTIFNFNLDGLATAYCRDSHCILEPHGSVDRLWLEAEDYEELLNATSAYDLMLPHVTPKLLPGPEPTTITEGSAYRAGRRLFRRSRALLLVGFSFGQWHGRYDDAESFEYFVDLLQTYPRPTAVLSPSPDELVDILQQRLRSRRVYALPVRWEVFSGVALGSAHPRHGLPTAWCDEQLKRFERDYYCAQEARQAA